MFSLSGKRVWVAGHRGMVGQAIERRLSSEGCTIVKVSRESLDLRDQGQVLRWMDRVRPEVIFHAAATVGGILANSMRPAEFLYDNLMLGANVIDAARHTSVQKLVYLGSSCIYPKDAPQPIVESALMSGSLEPTNEWYAIAKIAGLKLCQAYRKQYGCDFVTVLPTNLYGPGDNFDLTTSHVLPALMRKAHEAKKNGEPMTIWGSGSVLREFLHVDDLADALIFIVKHYSDNEPINVGTGEEISIADLATSFAKIAGLDSELQYDRSKPDGVRRKLVDVSKLHALGWKHSIGLQDGLAQIYRWYLDQAIVRGVATAPARASN